MDKDYKPLKRHKALYPLSHHHTNALHMALKLKRAGTEKSKLTNEELVKEADDFWEPEGLQHFREEEDVLLTAFAQHASVDIPEIREMLIEHVKIRALFATIKRTDEPDLETFHNLGELLEMHIRKEERIIFPMIEKALPEDKLQEIKPYLH